MTAERDGADVPAHRVCWGRWLAHGCSAGPRRQWENRAGQTTSNSRIVGTIAPKEPERSKDKPEWGREADSRKPSSRTEVRPGEKALWRESRLYKNVSACSNKDVPATKSSRDSGNLIGSEPDPNEGLQTAHPGKRIEGSQLAALPRMI